MGGLAPGQLKSRRGWHSSPRRLHYRFSFFDRGFKNSLREKLYQFCENGAFSSPSTCGSLALSGPPNWPSPTPPPTVIRSLRHKRNATRVDVEKAQTVAEASRSN